MPIGRRPPLTDTSSVNVLVTDGVAGEALGAGQAVGLQQVLGAQRVVLASASNVDTFLGFAKTPADIGSYVVVSTGRGSKVSPTVEGGVPLVVNQPVFLAATPGMVTQNPATLVGYHMLKLGVALTTTSLILKIDYAPQIPS